MNHSYRSVLKNQITFQGFWLNKCLLFRKQLLLHFLELPDNNVTNLYYICYSQTLQLPGIQVRCLCVYLYIPVPHLTRSLQ